MQHLPRGGLQEAGNKIEERQLSEARGTEKHDKLPLTDIQDDVLQHCQNAGSPAQRKVLRNVIDAQLCHVAFEDSCQGTNLRSIAVITAFMAKPMIPITIIPVSTN